MSKPCPAPIGDRLRHTLRLPTPLRWIWYAATLVSLVYCVAQLQSALFHTPVTYHDYVRMSGSVLGPLLYLKWLGNSQKPSQRAEGYERQAG